MRKYFLALIAVALVFSVSAVDFASAADIKMTGVMRFRGTSSDDADQDDTTGNHDGNQKIDSLWRPRWTMTSHGGKIKGVLELDATGDATSANSTGRANAEWNRYIVDFLIPGTTFRFRFGRSDWISPDKEIFASNGVSRLWGYGLYGKINKTLSLNAWNSQQTEGNSAHTDNNDYMLQLKWKAAPAITLTPWMAWEKYNGTGNGTAATTDGTERDIWFYAVNAQAKFGIASLNATALLQDGTLDFSRGVNAAGRKDIDVEAYAVLVRLWLNFGKLKIGFYGSFMPGDDDPTDTSGDLGTQFDSKLKRFLPPGGGGDGNDCSINGPQIVTRRRYSSSSISFQRESRCGSGDGGEDLNGSQMWEILAKYKLTKALSLEGNVSIVRSAAKRADEDTTGDGLADGTTYNSSKDVGTEVDLSAKYTIYKGLWARLTYAHLFAGDYGKLNTTTAQDNEDTWALYWELRYTF